MQHQHSRLQQSRRIGQVLTGNVRRRAVHRFKNRALRTEVCARHQSQSANKPRAARKLCVDSALRANPRNARVVIDACKPFKRRDTFPVVVRSSKEVDDLVRKKFSNVLPK